MMSRIRRKIYITTYAVNLRIIQHWFVTRLSPKISNVKYLCTWKSSKCMKWFLYCYIHRIVMVYLYNRVISWQRPNKKFRLESICNPAIFSLFLFFVITGSFLAWQANSGVRLSSILFQKKKFNPFCAH